MRSARRDTVALAGGSALSGLLAYLLFVLTTRSLGAEQAAPVSVLWSYWAFAAAAFTFPAQHWIARAALTRQGEGEVRQALPGLTAVVAAASGLLGGLAWLARDALFGRDDAWFPVLFALLGLGSAVIGVVRGALTARGRLVEVGLSLVAENGLRCIAVGALVLAGNRDPVAYGVALTAGHLVAGLWPSALRFARTSTSTSTRGRGPAGFLAGAGLGQLLAQTVLTGGPILLALAGGARVEVTALFAALALYRAPYILALGVVPQLTVAVTRLVVAEDDAAVRRLLRVVALGGTVTVAAAALLGALVGPALLVAVFGDGVLLGAGESAALAVGCGLAVTNLVTMVVALAEGAASEVAWTWVASVLLAAAAFWASGGLDPTWRTVTAFLVAEVVALLGLLAGALRARA